MIDIEKEDENMLKSILAQFEYAYQVCESDKKGVPFKIHFYVPEVHPITGAEFHEREDYALVLKYNITCMYIALHTHLYSHIINHSL